jgi:uncharacterized protein (UPF0333 family)
MIKFFKNNNINLIRLMLLLPIILVAFISITHVVSWYNISNPLSWSIYLSIAVEVAAMVAIIAASQKIKGGAWTIFIIVTLIQMIGNIFYSYKEIDSDGELFKSWVELTLPIWESVGTEPNDIVGIKRWLAFLSGGLLPIISLTSLHFFVKYQENQDDVKKDIVLPEPIIINEDIVTKDVITPTNEDNDNTIAPVIETQKITNTTNNKDVDNIVSEENIDNNTKKLVYTKN